MPCGLLLYPAKFTPIVVAFIDALFNTFGIKFSPEFGAAFGAKFSISFVKYERAIYAFGEFTTISR